MMVAHPPDPWRSSVTSVPVRGWLPGLGRARRFARARMRNATGPFRGVRNGPVAGLVRAGLAGLAVFRLHDGSRRDLADGQMGHGQEIFDELEILGQVGALACQQQIGLQVGNLLCGGIANHQSVIGGGAQLGVAGLERIVVHLIAPLHVCDGFRSNHPRYMAGA